MKPKDEWVVVKDIFEPIVDLELWERVQEVNGKRIGLIRQYSDLKELNSCIINELITKILVGDKHRVNGEKVQSIEIHYRFIGNLTDDGMEQVNKKSS